MNLKTRLIALFSQEPIRQAVNRKILQAILSSLCSTTEHTQDTSVVTADAVVLLSSTFLDLYRPGLLSPSLQAVLQPSASVPHSPKPKSKSKPKSNLHFRFDPSPYDDVHVLDGGTRVHVPGNSCHGGSTVKANTALITGVYRWSLQATAGHGFSAGVMNEDGEIVYAATSSTTTKVTTITLNLNAGLIEAAISDPEPKSIHRSGQVNSQIRIQTSSAIYFVI